MAKELTRQSCTDQQRKFLDSLHDEEVLRLPYSQRMRHCARTAGYSDNVNLRQILNPLRNLITAEAELVLAQASIASAWCLAGIVDGEGLDTIKDKLRMEAAKNILDRTIAPKSEVKGHGSPLVTIMLPPKSSAKVIDHVEDDE